MFSRLRRRPPAALPRVDTPAQWAALAARHGWSTSSRTETVKVVIDLADGAAVHFLDSNAWEMHYDYVERHLDPHVDYHRFNTEEYLREDRRYVLCAVTHHLDGGHWALELAGVDNLPADRIAWTHARVAERLGVTRALRFRPASPAQVAHAAALEGRIPTLSRDAINASVVYQPVVLGVAYGHLRIVEGPLDVAALRPYDVVVTAEVPEELPPVAALVTGELQAPLAHVAVLSRNRNTPDMALRGAAALPAFRALEGELVKLTVAGQDYALERAAREEAEADWEARRPRGTAVPARDLGPAGLHEVATLPEDATGWAGAKAAQLGRLARLDGIEVPPGLVIPFSAYARHLAAAGLDAAVAALLADPRFREDARVRAARLAALRAAIQAAPVDEALLAALVAGLARLAPGRAAILRSSTNAEDLDGFSGAGLYESLPVPAGAGPAQVADVLRRVWASVWLQRAFEEREWYRIRHDAVAMAVLVQPLLDDAVASGVAITGNPWKAGLDAVYLNLQAAGATVTGAGSHELPEQYLVTTFFDPPEIELLGTSSLTGGRLLLTEDEVRALTGRLRRVHDRLLPAGGGANAMDVEFVLTADRRFVLVQARPYRIVHDLDRRRRPEPGALVRLARRVRRAALRLLPRRARAGA